MKSSLRLKLSLVLMALVLIIIFSSVIISNFFLGDYYLLGKQKSLAASYHTINDRMNSLERAYEEVINDSSKTSINLDSAEILEEQKQKLNDSIEQIEVGTNSSVTVYTGSGLLLRIVIGKKETITDYFQADYYEVLVDKENYAIEQASIRRLNSDFLYLKAKLDNGANIVIRTSLQSIDESVTISNQFFVIIALVVVPIGLIAMYFITRQFTRPILDLAYIASKMAHMEFDTYYVGSSNDEIATLGNSINYLSDTLKSTLGELKSANSELQRDLERKIQVDEMRKEFLSNVSHELKTPIALIQGYAEGLIDNISDDEESRQFYCEVIVDEAKKMNNLVKKLLNLNQMEFGNNHINMEHCNLTDIITNILSNSDILFKQKEIKLEFDLKEDIYVWTDVYMTEEVFSNYLSNAIHHADGEKIIKITITQDNGTVRVSVFNTGAPIPEEDIDNIWIKFYKVDKARTREYGGSGVGLSIVKAAMDALGQNFGVINHSDGVEFWFELDAKSMR